MVIKPLVLLDMNDICILINSCAAYSDMWDNIDFLYKKYWSDHPEIILVTDKVVPNQNSFKIIEINKDMSDRLIDAVKQIKENYIFLSFDDYYPNKKVNVNKLNELFKTIKAKDIDYCRIFFDPGVKGKKNSPLNYKTLPLNRVYEVNFYPAIWKKESLLKLLRSGEDIWKSEARLTRRAKENNLNCIYVKNKGIFDFVDVVRKGKYLRSSYRFLKRNKLFISDREKRTIKETIALNSRIFLSNNLPKKMKENLKKKGRKKGAVYYSDYADTDD